MQKFEYEVRGWIIWFCNLKDNEFFCVVDPEWIQNRFNTYGLQYQFSNFDQLINLILCPSEPSIKQLQDENYVRTCKRAIDLYGLIHRRYIGSHQGLY